MGPFCVYSWSFSVANLLHGVPSGLDVCHVSIVMIYCGKKSIYKMWNARGHGKKLLLFSSYASWERRKVIMGYYFEDRLFSECMILLVGKADNCTTVCNYYKM